MRVMVGRRRVAVAHQRRLAVRRVEGHPRLRRRGRDVVAPRVGRAREAPVVVDGRVREYEVVAGLVVAEGTQVPKHVVGAAA